MKKSNISLIILVVAVIFITVSSAFDTIKFKNISQDEINTLMFNLGLIALVIERSLLVLLAVWRGEEKEMKKIDLEDAEHKFTLVKEQVSQSVAPASAANTPGAAVHDSSPLAKAKDQVTAAKKSLELYRVGTRALSIRVSFFIGILLSALGFRIFEFLFETNFSGPFQANLFSIADIVLTAGIVSGGSSGLNIFTKSLTQLLNKSTQAIPSKSKTSSPSTSA
ncbi:MAG: hypothetical protein RIC95_02990 [Vicingaceae bacterium]